MRKLLFIIIGLLLLAPLDRENVEIKKLFNEIERLKQHFKTHKITVDGDIQATNIIATTDVQAETFTYESVITRYYAISIGDFVPRHDGALWDVNHVTSGLRANSTTVAQTWYAGIHLPHGATVTSMSAWFYRDDASSTMEMNLQRLDSTMTLASLASVNATSTAGNHTETDSSITNAVIDNSLYTYYMHLSLDPNDSGDDVKFFGGYITYTITAPLP